MKKITCLLLMTVFLPGMIYAQNPEFPTTMPRQQLPKYLETKLSPADREMFTALINVNLTSAWGALSALGYPQNFTNEIAPFDRDKPLVGRARTYEMMPARKDVEATLPKTKYLFQLIDDTRPGDILVYAMNGYTGAGAGGDVSTTGFVVQGGAGILLDGAMHDLTLISKFGIPIYTRKGHASALRGSFMYTRMDVPVAFAGVTIVPGDIIYGDVAGLLVIPKDLVWDVIKTAKERDIKEEFQRIWIQRGHPVIGTYSETVPDAEYLKAYEQWKKEKGYK